jgi:PIN domain nuclease of toxin-antitoxin system
MKLLLDTCSLLWALQDVDRLSAPAKKALRNPENTVAVSVVSFWEIRLKAGLGKLAINGAEPGDVPAYVAQAGWTIVPLSAATAASSGTLPRLPEHRDPFDRLIVWTAIKEDFSLVSADRAFSGYAAHGLKICW